MQKITLDSKVLFDFDKAVLKPEGKAAIDSQVVGKLAQIQKLEVVLVTGHTDRLGTEAHNQKLSQQRADVVRDYLVSKGVDKAKIETIGMGEKQPVVQCDQKNLKQLIDCLQPNRRVEVQAKGDDEEVTRHAEALTPSSTGRAACRCSSRAPLPGATAGAGSRAPCG